MFRRKHPPGRLEPGQVVRWADGKLSMVVRMEWPAGSVDLEDLGTSLARNLVISDGDTGDPVRLHDALLAAGWTPPELRRGGA